MGNSQICGLYFFLGFKFVFSPKKFLVIAMIVQSSEKILFKALQIIAGAV